MKNILKFLGIIAIAAVIGFSMAGCLILDTATWEDSTTPPRRDPVDTTSRPSNVPANAVQNPANGNWYLVVDQSMLWSEARDEAVRRGGDLAMPNTEAANAFILNLIQQSGRQDAYWVGRSVENGRWTWVNGATFRDGDFHNWAPNRPMPTPQERMVILRQPVTTGSQAGQWVDVRNSGFTDDGTRRIGYVIEWQGTAPRPSHVPADAVQNPANGNWYLVVNQSLDWQQARDYAAARNGYLSVITTQAEQTFLWNLIQRVDNGDKDAYWLGIYRNPPNLNWFSLTNEDVVYYNWASNRPTSIPTEDRVTITIWSNGQWNNITSARNDKVGFVIEWDR